MYALRAGSGISDAFLFEHVVPGICSRLPNEVARVLALPLLFAIFSQGSGEGFPAGYLPAAFCEQVKNSYNSLAVHLGDGLNPVKRVPLAINGSDAQLFLDPIELMDVDAEEEDATVHHGACAGAGAVVNNNDVVQQAVQQQQKPLVAPHQPQHAAGLAMQRRRGGTERDIILALHSKIVQMDAEVKLIRTALAEQQIRIERGFERGFTTVNANIWRIQQIPFTACPRRHARVNKEGAGAAAAVEQAGVAAPAALGQEGTAAAGGGADAAPAAEWTALSDTPRALFQLWHEYQHGIGGRKPQDCLLVKSTIKLSTNTTGAR